MEDLEIRAREKKERKGGAMLLLSRPDSVFVRLRGLTGTRIMAALLDDMSAFLGTPAGIATVLVVGLGVFSLYTLAKAVASPEGRSPAAANGVFVPRGVPGFAGVVHDEPPSYSLDYFKQANRDELASGRRPQEESAAETEPPEPAAPALPEEPAPKPAMVAAKLEPKTLLHGALALNGLGRVPGEERLRDGLAGFNLKKSFNPAATVGTLRALPALRRSIDGRVSRKPIAAGRALGQLKAARNLSEQGRYSAGETRAREFSTAAFEGGRTLGATGPSFDEGSIVVPPGDGAPGLSAAEEVPEVPAATPADPTQPLVDRARDSSDDAADYKLLGMLLLALGAAMVLLGMALMAESAGAGAFLVGMGLALVAGGIGLLVMSQNKAKDAQDQADTLRSRYGQNDQAAIIDECSDTGSAACRPSQGGR